MKKLLLLIAIAGIAMFALLGRGRKDVGQPAVTAPTPVSPAPKPVLTGPPLTQTIADLVKSGNEKLPAMVDKQTRLDKVEAGPGAQLTYRYTLPDLAPPTVDGYWIITEVQPKVTRDVCDTPMLRQLLAAGATLVYAYKDKNGADINRFTIKNADCVRIGFK